MYRTWEQWTVASAVARRQRPATIGPVPGAVREGRVAFLLSSCEDGEELKSGKKTFQLGSDLFFWQAVAKLASGANESYVIACPSGEDLPEVREGAWFIAARGSGTGRGGCRERGAEGGEK
jgi:hypothetical protein